MLRTWVQDCFCADASELVSQFQIKYGGPGKYVVGQAKSPCWPTTIERAVMHELFEEYGLCIPPVVNIAELMDKRVGYPWIVGIYYADPTASA